MKSPDVWAATLTPAVCKKALWGWRDGSAGVSVAESVLFLHMVGGSMDLQTTRNFQITRKRAKYGGARL